MFFNKKQAILSLLFLSFKTLANSNYQEKAIELKLWESPKWSSIMFYKSSLFGGVKSDIRSSEFFFSPNGRTNPKEELLASLKELTTVKKSSCKFISRYHFFKEKLNLNNQDCPGFNKWTRNNSIKSLSMVFATGYLGNPASYFGHPLLKFNFERKTGSKNLLDISVNYGANTPKQVNPFLYAFKGIFGGYEASFSHLNFYYNNHNYTEVEQRDLWEYELDLNSLQRDQIVRQTWELLGMKFPYYFTQDNCANRMGELLETVINKSILPKYVPYAIPHSLFANLNEMGLVKKITFHPSRKSQLRHKIKSASRKSSILIKKIIMDGLSKHKKDLFLLKIQEKLRVVETLFDYYSFRLSEDPEDEDLIKNRKELLRERIKLPKGKAIFEKQLAPKKSPHNAQKAVTTRFGSFYNKDKKWGGTFHWRTAYYDLLSLDIGEASTGSLAIFAFKLSFTDNNIWLNYLDLASLTSLNISETGLPGDGGWASKFRVGLDNQDMSFRGKVTPRLYGGIGKAFALGNSLITYAYINGRAQAKVKTSGSFALEPEFGSLIELVETWKINLSIGRRIYLDGDKSKEYVARIENRFFKSKTWDLRLILEKHVEKQIEVSYGRFW